VTRLRRTRVGGIGEAPSTLLADLFPGDVATAEWWGAGPVAELLPAEREAIARSVPKRQSEFAAGRICVRRALTALGVPCGPLLSGYDRLPLWPQAIVGCISHTNGYCGAAIAREAEFLGIGLDVETIANVDERLAPLICTPSEIAWLTGQPIGRHRSLTALLFSAKECLFKCLFPITKEWFNFLDVSVEVRDDTFYADFADRLGGGLPPARPPGRFAFHDGLVVTGLTLYRREQSNDAKHRPG
jgi:enterobactin synthetase component D / holo-[acyl-carrier protein] synthase